MFGQGDLWVRDGRAFARLTPLEVVGEGKVWYRTGEPDVRELARRRCSADAQGPALRHGVHLRDLPARARGAGGHPGREPAAGPAGHEREGLHGLVPGLLRADPDHARHGGNGGLPRASTARPCSSRSTAWAAARSSSSRRATGTRESCSRRSPTAAAVTQSRSATCPEIATGGDARILLVDGEPVPHALVRMPAAGDHRGNLAAGARAESRAADRARSLAGLARSGRPCASAACCSSVSTSSAASSPRST